MLNWYSVQRSNNRSYHYRMIHEFNIVRVFWRRRRLVYVRAMSSVPKEQLPYSGAPTMRAATRLRNNCEPVEHFRRNLHLCIFRYLLLTLAQIGMYVTTIAKLNKIVD